MNSQSSRSHAIFTITIENGDVGEDGKQHIKMGKLHLVDLAVSYHRQQYSDSTLMTSCLFSPEPQTSRIISDLLL